MPWTIILGAFIGSLVGSIVGVVAVYLVISHFSRQHQYTAVSPELLERVEATKRRYGIPDFELDEETLELGMEPE